MEENLVNQLQGVTTADVINMLNNTPNVYTQIEEAPKVVKKNKPSTGMIMDAVETSEEADVANENMQAALENNRMAQIQAMMAARKQKVREHKVGRNDACPCGSGKKYKKCCLSTGTYEKLIDKK